MSLFREEETEVEVRDLTVSSSCSGVMPVFWGTALLSQAWNPFIAGHLSTRCYPPDADTKVEGSHHSGDWTQACLFCIHHPEVQAAVATHRDQSIAVIFNYADGKRY